MKAIEYVYASEGGFEIIIAGRLSDLNSHSQTLISVRKSDGENEEIFSMAAFGDWETEYAIAMLQGLSKSLIQGMRDAKTKKIDPAQLEHTRDMCITLKNHKIDKGKLNIYFTSQDVAYHLYGSYGKNIGESSVSVKIDPEDADGLGRAIIRACEEWDCQHLMHVGNDDWIISQDALYAYEREVSEIHGIVESEKVKKHAPEIIKKSWSKLIRDKTKTLHPNFSLRSCRKCRGKIAAESDWKKECRGCYFGAEPTAMKPQDIKKIRNSKVIKK